MSRRRTSLAMTLLVAAGCGGPARREATPPPPPPPAVASESPVTIGGGERAPSPAPLVLSRVGATGGEGDEAAAEAAAREAIARLEVFVASHPDHPEYTPDALVRLGSLQLDVADLALGREDEAAFAAASAAAATALTTAVDRFPTHARRDVALYLLGFAREQTGDRAGAAAAWEAAAAIHGSSLAAEARFRAGELYFEDGQLDRAAAAYAEVLASGGAPLAALARYKLAWSYYRLDRLADAAATFEAVVHAADAGDPTSAMLRDEAARTLAICREELAAPPP